MEIEIAEATCRLCKRPITSAGMSPDTRLCDQCQSMVHGMAPGSRPVAPTIAVQHEQVQAPLPPQPQFQTKHIPQPQRTVRPADSSGQISQQPSGPLDELAELFAESTPTGPLSQPRTPQPAAPSRSPQPQPAAAPGNFAAAQPPVYLAPPAEPQPVQRWDRYANQPGGQWPLLVEQQQQQENKPRRRTPILLFAIFAFVVAGAGGYFLVTRLLTKGVVPGRGQVAAARTDSVKPSTPTAPATSDGRGGSQPAPALAKQQAASQHAPDTPSQPAPQAPSGEGAFTLQAASFPNEAGAKAFSEQLIRAGISAYVIAADLPGRGRWFRVRVGRFASADEAGKYAAQSKQRAAAARIGLQLIVCGYEKP